MIHLPGNRIVKTAVAVFLTAFICQWIGWPPVFAVITAIVTLEPTVSDSIKKGLVRFPASAIGSFYAVLFIALFGNSPITYTLAASLTIITCFQLRLHAGLLVATITAVAMIEVVYDHYFLSFLTRLGTTTIGIVVSTVVNLFIFPPNYIKDIQKNLKDIYTELGKSLQLLKDKSKMKKATKQIRQKIDKTQQLIRYQVAEENFRPFFDKEENHQTTLLDELEKLALIHYHIQNLQPITLQDTAFSYEHQQVIQLAVQDATKYMLGNESIDLEFHDLALKHLMRKFWRSSHSNETFNRYALPDELVVLYELIAIFHLIGSSKKTVTV